MEYFEEIGNVNVNADDLKALLTIEKLPKLCASIDNVISDEKTHGVIYCVWGEYEINREELKHGVRFTLPGCPNALAWSVTVDDNAGTIVIYTSINKQKHEEDFIESIKDFMQNCAEGLNGALYENVLGELMEPAWIEDSGY